MRAECECRLGPSLALPRTPSPILRITQGQLRSNRGGPSSASTPPGLVNWMTMRESGLSDKWIKRSRSITASPGVGGDFNQRTTWPGRH